MFDSFDPLVLGSVMMLQVANRFMKIEMTKAQEKIIYHPYVQILMYFCIIFFTTRNVRISLIIVVISYIFFAILLNENHKFNLLSKSWLHDEKIVEVKEFVSEKDIYKNKLKELHS